VPGDHLPAAPRRLVESTAEAADMALPITDISAFGIVTMDDHAKVPADLTAA
jgi:hypothetical protein